MGLSLTLYHNAQTTWSGTLGPGWSTNYHARIVGTHGNDVVMRWGDGTVIPYDHTQNGYVPPAGIFDKLVWTGDLWLLTKPDQTVYTFYEYDGALHEIEDRHGNQVTIDYEPGVGIETITAPDGRYIHFNYDGQPGRISSFTDSAGRQWRLFYEAGKLWKVEYPLIDGIRPSHQFLYSGNLISGKVDFNGNYTSLAYSPTDPAKLVATTTPMGNMTTFAYDDDQCTITLPVGHQIVHNYSGGQLVSVVDPAGYSTSQTYSGNLVTSFTDKRGKTSNLTWDNRGNLLSATDPLSHSVSFTYNSTNDMLTARDALNNTTHFGYNSFGDLTSITDPLNHVTSLQYNSLGQLTSTTDAMQNVYSFEYDSYGNVSQVTDPLGHSSSAIYGVLSQIESVEDALGNEVLFGYDDWYRPTVVVQPNGAMSWTEYGYEGEVTALMDSASNETTIEYDDEGKTVGVTNANNQTQTFAYDDNGWICSSTNARGAVRQYLRNQRGDVTTIALPNVGNMNFTYDANGAVATYNNASGTNTYVYDNAGRRTNINYPAGVGVTLTYDNADRLTSMTDSQGTSNIAYNAGSEVTQLSAPAGTINYTYDAIGRPLTMQRVGWASPVTYAYDAASRLTSLTNQFNQVTTFGYDNADRLTQMTLSNGTYTTYGYDNNSRMNSLGKFKAGPIQFRSETYNYNSLSQLTSKVIDGVSTSYAYDNIGQLLTENTAGYSASYTYDANGNRLSKTLNGVTDTYSYDLGDRLLGITSPNGNKTFTYGTLGRTKTVTTSAGTRTYNYDYEGRISGIVYPGGGTETYGYNGASARVKRIDSATGTRYYSRDGLMPASDILSDSANSYTPGISERSGGIDKFYNDDGLGSVTDLTDTTGNVIVQRTWDAFGNLTSGSSNYFRGWNESSGYEDDSVSGLKLLGYRHYDPSIGRFLTMDPIGDGSNWYAYCENDPISYVDPLGLSVGQPGFLESLIPFWGSGRAAIDDFQNGKWGWGTFNTVLTISDVLLVGTVGKMGAKVGWKGLVGLGDYVSWSGVRKYLGGVGFAEYGQHVHHWIISQKAGKKLPRWLVNNIFNLNPIKGRWGYDSATIHYAIHGAKTKVPLNMLQRIMLGSPDWAKYGTFSGMGRFVNAGRDAS